MIEISVEHITAMGCIGVNPEEKINPQPYVVDVKGYIKDYALDDDLEKTVNYTLIRKAIENYISSSQRSLIESAAIDCVRLLLRNFIFDKVGVRMYKPNVNKNTNTSVYYESQWSDIAVSIGSNLGDSEAIIHKATEEIINNQNDFKDIKVSSLIKTKPYGKTDQPDFLNGALVGKTVLDPYQLLHYFQSLEQEAARVRKEHWGPRTLDLDIVFFGDKVIRDRYLNIPHADWMNREFVLKPLMELIPDYCPINENLTISELYHNKFKQ